MTNKLSNTLRRAWEWLLCRPPTDAESEANSTEKEPANRSPQKARRSSKFRGFWESLTPARKSKEVPNDEPSPETKKPAHLASPTTPTPDSAIGDAPRVHVPRTVVVFGSTGVGKSSVINMLQNANDSDPPAKVENSTHGVTSSPHVYQKLIEGEPYRVIDTIGTGESEGGTASTADAIDSFYKTLLNQSPGGVNLIVFVIRTGRITKMEENNYKFIEMVCGGSIPVVLVVTGVENEPDVDGWWIQHQGDRFKKLSGHTCIVATKGRKDGLAQLYEDSKPKLNKLISEHASKAGYKIQPIPWMEWLIGEVRFLMRTSRDELHDALYGLLCDCGIPEKRAQRMSAAVNLKPSMSRISLLK